MTQHQKFGKEKIHAAMDREPGNKTENNTKKKQKKSQKMVYQSWSKFFWEKWDFFCLEVNKEKVATYYHFLFIFPRADHFLPESSLYQGLHNQRRPWLLFGFFSAFAVCAVALPANEKSFFASHLSPSLSIFIISVSLLVSSQPCRLWMSCSTCRWKTST